MTKLRVHHGLLVANMVEDHHEGVLHAACGRWRAPGVMTTTLVQSYYYLSYLILLLRYPYVR